MKKLIVTAVAFIGLVACKNSKNDFLITNNSIGVLQKNTPIQKLDSIFAKDSIVMRVLSALQFLVKKEKNFLKSHLLPVKKA